MAVHDPPPVSFPPKHHRRSELQGGRRALAGEVIPDHFRLDKVGEFDPDEADYLIPTASALRELRTDPSKAIPYVLPSTFHTTEATTESNVIGMRP